jgi:arginyl-tRNA synthetase
MLPDRQVRLAGKANVATMKTPRHILSDRLEQAFRAANPSLDGALKGPLAVPTQSAEHGDYQCNQALSLAKALKTNPRALATSVLEHLDVTDVCEAPQIAGPGFINLRLQAAWVGEQLRARLGDERLGVERVAKPRTVHIDFSSPNVAKPMHVGHIRSTVIGDVITRVLRFAGHKVISDNHLGDWGTQFGMMIVGYRDLADKAALEKNPIGELQRVYRQVNERCGQDEAYAEMVRGELVKLQQGDPDHVALWQKLVDITVAVDKQIYARLGVEFDEWCGESFYNDKLAAVVDDLQNKGVAREDQGALVVFFDEPEELRERPFIVRKKDGASLYATTDLASVQYRVGHHHADTIIYVTDGRQQLHFKQLIATARKWGYDDVDFVHVWFGSILGADNKPIKTREGEPIELASLLDEAEERALALVREKSPELSDEQQRQVARVIGIGAVKYSDLAQNRTSDYVFSWDRMLALQGNTAPYMQYAFARINSIFTKAGVTTEEIVARRPLIALEHSAELALGKLLLRFGDAIDEVLEDYRPNFLTTYLFEVAQQFSNFFEHCPVIQSEEPVRSSRLALCHLTARTLELGLSLLGIGTLPRM